MVTLRPYRVADEETVVTLWWKSWHSIRPGLRHPHPFSDWRARWATEIATVQAIVVAEEEGVVVGFAAADVSARVLSQIFVDPSLKRRGLGRRLLAWAQQSMPHGFSLHTLVGNVGSRAFYERHGLVAGGVAINPVNGMETVEYRWEPTSPRRPRVAAPRTPPGC